MKKFIYLISISVGLVLISCRTQMVMIDKESINHSAISAIQKYYPEYNEEDMILSGISYSSNPKQSSDNPELFIDLKKNQNVAEETVLVSYTIRATISESSTDTEKIVKAKKIYVTLLPDGSPASGKNSISFNYSTQKIKKCLYR